jgi:hypothetical protein
MFLFFIAALRRGASSVENTETRWWVELKAAKA